MKMATLVSENDGEGGKTVASGTEATPMDSEEAGTMSNNPNNATQVDASILEENQTQEGSDDDDDGSPEAGQIEPDNEDETGNPEGDLDVAATEGDPEADL